MSVNFEQGTEISIDGTSIAYDDKNDEYEIEIHDATLLCLDIKSQLMRIKIHSNKLKLINNDNNKINSSENTKQHIDDEPSDDTEQEQEEEDDDDDNTNENLELNDEKKEDNNTPQKQIKEYIINNNGINGNNISELNEETKENNISPKQEHIINNNMHENENENGNISESDQTQNSEPLIPNDQDEIIELSHDEKEEDNNDEYIKKQNPIYNDIITVNNDQNNINIHTNHTEMLKDIVPNECLNDNNKSNDIHNVNESKNDIVNINESIISDKIPSTDNITDNIENITNKNLQSNDEKKKDNIPPKQEQIINNNINENDNDITNKPQTENNINNNIDTIENITDTPVQQEPGNENQNQNENENENENTESKPHSNIELLLPNIQINNEIEIKTESLQNDNKLEAITVEGHIDNMDIDIKIDYKPMDMLPTKSGTPSHSQNTKNDVDEYASSDEMRDEFHSENERSIKIEHNLRDPFIDELLTQQINAAFKIESEDEPKNAEEYINSNEEEGIKNAIKYKNNWQWALKPENIASEWRKYAPTINLQNFNTMTKSLTKITTNSITSIVNIATAKNKVICTLTIDECDCVHRLIFIMKYYSFWMKFKIETLDYNNINNQDVDINEYYQSVTQLIGSLKAYNRSKLLRDYLHIRHYHFNDDKLIAYIHRSQIPDCNDKNKMCKCITRNHQNKEIYKNVNIMQGRKLYWMDKKTNINKESMEEMIEINLQKLLDVIHSSFLHNAISNGTKFVTKINIGQEEQLLNAANNIKEKRRTAFSSLSSLNSAVSAVASSSELKKPIIIDVPNYEFGIKFNFHDRKQQKNYCGPKYPDLKTELLNNAIHSLTINDFTSIYNQAQEYIQCDEGCKSIITKRVMYRVYKGTKINIQNVIVILTRCNYSEIERKFNMNSWMQRNKKDNNRQALRDQNAEIAHWNRLLIETITLFGDLLDDSQYVYHGINYKITFKDISGIQFNMPVSCTSQYSVARNFANEYSDGICLKLGKMQLSKDKSYMLDISDFSDYPNEREVLIFGDKLSFVDIVYDSLSHHDYVLSLKLYQKIVKGRWFTTHNDYHNKKHQRRIVKMIENMIEQKREKEKEKEKSDNDDGMVDLDLGLNYIDPYIQSLFETITKNVLKRTIWINKESDTLLPELKTVFINDFIPFLKKKPFCIQSKYAHVDTWIITKKYLLMTDRNNVLKSKPFDHVEILNNDDMDDNTDIDEEEDEKGGQDKNVTTPTKEKQQQVNHEPMTLKQFKKKIAESKSKNQPTDLKITFGFRCYKKYDSMKKQAMFKGEFIVEKLPDSIESVKMLGGLWFPTIQLCKWDWCSFSNKKKSKGSSLFALNQLNDDDPLKIKICYQVKEVIEKVFLP